MTPLLVFSVLLGLLVGIDPGKGWLYCVYQREFRGGLAALNTFLANLLAIGSSTLLMLAPALFVYSTGFATRLLLLVYALGSILHGALRLAFPRVHYRGSLTVGPRGVFIWSLVNSTWEGYGLPVGALLLLGGYNTPVLFLLFYTLISVSMFTLSKRFGVMLAKRVWLNYDLFVSALYILLGSIALLGGS